MSRSYVHTAILADDSVALFNEITQRMISLNRTAAYLWFRHTEIDDTELARELAARSGMPLADAKRSIDEHIAIWKAAGFIASDGVNDAAALAHLAAGPPELPPFSVRARSAEHTDLAPPARGGDSLYGRLPGLDFRIRYEQGELRELLESALKHLVGAACNPVDLTIDVRSDDAGWTVLDSGRVLGRRLRVNEIVPVVMYSLLEGLLHGDGYSIAFHASAARRNGRCVVLPAPGGSGKSTLCAALLRSGYEFISDDVVLFDEASPGLRGVPFPLSLKEGSWPALLTGFPQLEALPVHARPDRKRVKYLIPPVVAPADHSHAVGWVIFPQFRPNSGVELRNLDQSLALNRLVSEAFTPSSRLSGESFNHLASLVRPTTCWELRFPSLDAAVATINQVCR